MWQKVFRITFLVLTLTVPCTAAHAITYNLGADWSDTNNPNGVWSYNDGGGAITNHLADWTGSPDFFVNAQPAWADAPSGPGHVVSWFKSTNNVFDWLVGDVITHSWDAFSGPPTSTPNSNVTWTSPGAGTIDITGAVWLARNIGRSVNWSLAINGGAVTGGSLFDGDAFNRSNPFNLAAGSGGAGVLSDVSVGAGDLIRLSFLTTSTFGEFTGINLNVDFTPSTTPVPEPSTLLLLGSGLIGLLTRWRFRQKIEGEKPGRKL